MQTFCEELCIFLIPIGKGIMWVKPYANHLNI